MSRPVTVGSGGRAAAQGAFARITDLEQGLDEYLTRPSVAPEASQSLVLAAERWSAAV